MCYKYRSDQNIAIEQSLSVIEQFITQNNSEFMSMILSTIGDATN